MDSFPNNFINLLTCVSKFVNYEMIYICKCYHYMISSLSVSIHVAIYHVLLFVHQSVYESVCLLI